MDTGNALEDERNSDENSYNSDDDYDNSEDDPDYVPDADTSGSESGSEDESDAEENHQVAPFRRKYIIKIVPAPPPDPETASFNAEEIKYWKTLTAQQKEEYQNMLTVITKNAYDNVPLRFKIMTSDIPNSAKDIILKKLNQFNSMSDHSGEYFKLRNWFSGLASLPLGVYKSIDTSNPVDFLGHVRNTLDETVYGHTEAKDHILKILAQWISNPASRGHCIGIQGGMGIGKTSLIKDGLAKALDLPFAFIPLGGASDGSLLEGHGFTYEGSHYGKIAESLMKAKCMNPIFFFDELDKISTTSRGEEISSILTHITDSTQNDHFCDRYFAEIGLNLSKALMIFSYNDESMINPILKDRMITIRVKGYTVSDKVVIAQKFLIPKALEQYGITGITFSDDIIKEIIHRIDTEQGVRGLKRNIESIIGWLNMFKYIPPSLNIKKRKLDDKEVTLDHLDHLLNKSDIENKQRISPIETMYI